MVTLHAIYKTMKANFWELYVQTNKQTNKQAAQKINYV